MYVSKIAIDVMGGDNAPDEIIKGCVRASKEVESTLVLVGPEALIKEKLSAFAYEPSKIEIVDAEEVIDMEDSPTLAIRKKEKIIYGCWIEIIKRKASRWIYECR